MKICKSQTVNYILPFILSSGTKSVIIIHYSYLFGTPAILGEGEIIRRSSHDSVSSHSVLECGVWAGPSVNTP